MKKVLALILVLIVSVTPMLVFAETAGSDILGYASEQLAANDTTTVYANDTVYTRYFNHSQTPVFQIGGSSVATAPAAGDYGKWQIRNTPVVYKIPLPKFPASQVLDEFYLHYTGTDRNTTFTSVFKLPGEGWESKEGMSVNHTEAKSYIDNAFGSSKAYEAFESTGISFSDGSSAGNRIRVNLSKYAKECIEANQTYMYVGVIDKYTAQVYGYDSNQQISMPTVSFKFKAYEGLLTSKENVSFDKQYVLASDAFKVYNDGGIKKNVTYLWYELPLPALTDTQSIVDYKLNIYNHNDIMETGYNKYIAYKDDNGAQRLADSANLATLALGDVIAGNKEYRVKGSKQYDAIKLTSYANELSALGKDKMYIAVTTGEANSSSFACASLSAAKVPYVEYTIHDSNGIYSGNDISEFKIVLSATDRANAENVPSLAAGTAYRAVVKAKNYDASSVAMNMYVAIYNDVNELYQVKVLPCEITANDTDVLIWSDEFVVEEGNKNVKVFLWTPTTMAPLSESITSAVLQ